MRSLNGRILRSPGVTVTVKSLCKYFSETTSIFAAIQKTFLQAKLPVRFSPVIFMGPFPKKIEEAEY